MNHTCLHPIGTRLLLASTIAGICSPSFAQEGEIENIIVRGQRVMETMELEKALTPGAVSTLNLAEMHDRSVSNMADALRYVPGVWSVSSSGGGSAFYSSRGSNLDATNYDANGVKLLQDGLPVTTADGNNHNRSIDPMANRGASIARGANALKYGASTLGGAMDFVTPTARNSDPVQINLNAGSFGQRQGRLTLGRELGERLDGLVTLDVKDRDGYRDHSEASTDALYGNLGWMIGDDVETRFYATYHDYEEELPGGLTAAELETDPAQFNPSTATGNFQFDVVTRRLANKTTIALSDVSSLELGISREVQKLYHPIVDVRIDFDGPGPGAPTQVFSLLIDTEQTNTGTMARYNRKIGDHNLVVGFNWGETGNEGGNYSHNGGVATRLDTIVDNSAESLEAFVMDRWSVNDRLTLTYGLQAVQAEREISNIAASTGVLRNPKDDYDSINPRAGFIYTVAEGIDLYGNLSKLYEAPTNYELEDDARGNSATLKAMQGKVLEIGTRGTRTLGPDNFWNFDVSLYYAAIEDEILSQDDPNAPGTSLSVNVDDTIHAGLEALVGGSFTIGAGRIEPLISFTLNEFSFDSDALYGNNTLPAAPGYVVHGEVMYRANNGFFAGPTFDVVDERYADFMNSYEVDSYSLLGFRAGLNRANWQAYLEFRNVTDEEYVSTFSVVDHYGPASAIFNSGEPRAVYAGVQIRL